MKMIRLHRVVALWQGARLKSPYAGPWPPTRGPELEPQCAAFWSAVNIAEPALRSGWRLSPAFIAYRGSPHVAATPVLNRPNPAAPFRVHRIRCNAGSASGRAICCPCTNEISRRWQSETYPRTWASFREQCHSPMALRQYSLSVSSGVYLPSNQNIHNHHGTHGTSRRRTSSSCAANGRLQCPSFLRPRSGA
jgi:hypothetical protein